MTQKIVEKSIGFNPAICHLSLVGNTELFLRAANHFLHEINTYKIVKLSKLEKALNHGLEDTQFLTRIFQRWMEH